MRLILLLFAVTYVASLQAQAYIPATGMNYMQQGAFNHYNLLNDSNSLQKKWSVSSYAGIGAGIGFFNAGNAAFFPAQIGLQVNRRLNNNMYAFAGISTAPAFFNFNRSVNNTSLHQNYMAAPGFNANGFGIYSGIQAGLMYVNDAKTFSISGSIGVSNSSYPFYPANRNRLNAQKQPALTGSRQ
ncbi:MAG: hypothetical protein ABIQ88_23500 [Chitinophagaceae bacterium]